MSDTQQPTPTPAPVILTAKDLEELNTYLFTVQNGPGGRPLCLKCRRIDLFTQLMEDVINQPLLDAATGIMNQVQKWANEEGGSFTSAFERLQPAEKNTVLEQLRRYAVTAVLEPKLSMEMPAPAGTFPVHMLSADLLFGLWHFTPPQATISRLSEVAAKDFRAEPGHGAGAAAPAGDSVRPAAEPVATH